MEAGRELDALVAEKVMGGKTHGETSEPCRLCRGLGFSHPAEPCEACQHTGTVPVIYELRYSTDIAAAWEVVERLEQDGWELFLDRIIGPKRGETAWYAVFRADWKEDWGLKPSRVALSGPGVSAPLAICLASLKTGKPL